MNHTLNVSALDAHEIDAVSGGMLAEWSEMMGGIGGGMAGAILDGMEIGGMSAGPVGALIGGAAGAFVGAMSYQYASSVLNMN